MKSWELKLGPITFSYFSKTLAMCWQLKQPKGIWGKGLSAFIHGHSWARWSTYASHVKGAAALSSGEPLQSWRYCETAWSKQADHSKEDDWIWSVCETDIFKHYRWRTLQSYIPVHLKLPKCRYKDCDWTSEFSGNKVRTLIVELIQHSSDMLI